MSHLKFRDVEHSHYKGVLYFQTDIRVHEFNLAHNEITAFPVQIFQKLLITQQHYMLLPNLEQIG
jgi:hypothetical protein